MLVVKSTKILLDGELVKKIAASALFVLLALMLSGPIPAYARKTTEHPKAEHPRGQHQTQNSKAQAKSEKQWNKQRKQQAKAQKKQLKQQKKDAKKWNNQKNKKTISVT